MDGFESELTQVPMQAIKPGPAFRCLGDHRVDPKIKSQSLIVRGQRVRLLRRQDDVLEENAGAGVVKSENTS